MTVSSKKAAKKANYSHLARRFYLIPYLQQQTKTKPDPITTIIRFHIYADDK
jgi:hypothetical protein